MSSNKKTVFWRNKPKRDRDPKLILKPVNWEEEARRAPKTNLAARSMPVTNQNNSASSHQAYYVNRYTAGPGRLPLAANQYPTDEYLDPSAATSKNADVRASSQSPQSISRRQIGRDMINKLQIATSKRKFAQLVNAEAAQLAATSGCSTESSNLRSETAATSRQTALYGERNEEFKIQLAEAITGIQSSFSKGRT